MAGGRQREPIALMLIKGKKHLTKAEIEERQELEIKGNTDNIEPPSYLPEGLYEEFDKIANELIRIGIMANTDVDILARFIFAREQYVRLSLALRRTGVLHDDYGKILNNQDKLFRQCNAAASELGLTISSRCRLQVPKKKVEEKTPFEKKFGAV